MQDEILIKYLLGEAAVEEAASVEAWLEDNSVNQAYLLKLRNIWDKSQLLEKGDSYNTEQQWQLLKSKIHSTALVADSINHKGKVLPLKSDKRVALVRWAAALIILVLGSWIIFQNYFKTDSLPNQLILTATASPITDTLSDGSIITLNHYSRLQAPLKFNGNTREVSLEAGEAFFKVLHDDKKPFLVHSGKVDVKVLGTSFNVKNETNATLITVATGKVQVLYKGQQLILNPQERAVVEHETERLSKQPAPSLLYNYYVTHEFIANNTRLEDLVKVLNEAYRVNIVFGNETLKDLRLTTVFAKQPIDRILDVIAVTFNIQVVRQKDVIILK